VALVLVLGAVGFAATGVVRIGRFLPRPPVGKADMVTLRWLLVADLIIAGALGDRLVPVRPVARGWPLRRTGARAGRCAQR